MTPGTLLALANLTVPRKPDRGPAIHPDPLASAATAAQALGLSRVNAAQVGVLRELHQTIVELVDGLLDGRSVAAPAARLVELANPSTATVRIDVGGSQMLRPDLVFYDTTRSGTRRWHAESPCGLRERQRRYKTASRSGSPTEGR